MIVGKNEEGYDIVQCDNQHWKITANGNEYIYSTLSTAFGRTAEYPAVRNLKTLQYGIRTI